MKLLTANQTANLRSWFIPERQGPLIGLHVIHTGNGACYADRWPDPGAVLVETGGNYSLLGDPNALSPTDLSPHIEGFVETTKAFLPSLRSAFPAMRSWDRVIFEQSTTPQIAVPHGCVVRRLESVDTYHLWGITPANRWISETWGGPTGLAASGYGWGAFVKGRLAAIACTFFVGERFEEIGVVTEPAFRGKGLSTAVSGALIGDIHGRGRQPSWTTSPDNIGSLRVAEKLGFAVNRYDKLYVVGSSIPESA